MPRSPATKVGAWRRKYPGALPAVRSTNEGSSNGQAVMVELLIDGIWTDLSILGLVLSGNQVQINQRGRPGENSVSGPATCNFDVKNFDAAFSLANPMSPYWGKIGLGTRTRVSVPRGNGVSRRFVGELSAVPQETDITGNYTVISFEAAGILRRLGIGERPVRSPLYREITLTDPGAIGGVLRGYWPMEDVVGSRTLSSALGHAPMTFTGTPDLSAYADFVCSDAIPNLDSQSFKAVMPPYSPRNGGSGTDDAAEVCFLLSAPSGITAGAVICQVAFITGTINYTATLTYVSTDTVELSFSNADGSLTGTTGSVAMPVAGDLQMVELVIATNHGFASSQTDLILYQHIVGSATHSFVGTVTIGPFSTNTVKSVTLNSKKSVSDFYVGHLSVFEVPDNLYTINGVGFDSLNAYAGEKADVRFNRLCSEERITHEVRNGNGLVSFTSDLFDGLNYSNADGVPMGFQTIDTLMNLLRACERTDDGVIYEMTSDFGLGYRSSASLFNQSAAVTLDHSAHELSAPLSPLVDDSFVANDVTATRIGGSSFTDVQLTGRRSVLPPPAGMGPYPVAEEFSLFTDDQAIDEASWLRSKGTVDEARYKAVSVNLNSNELAGTVQRNVILDVICGDRAVIANVPVKYGPEDISQLAVGFTETIDQFEHRISMNCVPETPFHVLQLDTGPYSGLSSAGSTLVDPVSTTDTSWTVATVSGSEVWTDSATYASNFPFDWMVDGERVTVTAITGTSSPQTATVTRSVNGVVKTHDPQAVIQVADPTVLALGG